MCLLSAASCVDIVRTGTFLSCVRGALFLAKHSTLPVCVPLPLSKNCRFPLCILPLCPFMLDECIASRNFLILIRGDHLFPYALTTFSGKRNSKSICALCWKSNEEGFERRFKKGWVFHRSVEPYLKRYKTFNVALEVKYLPTQTSARTSKGFIVALIDLMLGVVVPLYCICALERGTLPPSPIHFNALSW